MKFQLVGFDSWTFQLVFCGSLLVLEAERDGVLLSTILQPCNYSGLYDYDAYPSLARFGVVEFDWSNAKRTWINHSPMDCDAMLAEQAARNRAKNPAARVFVYRNIVKALPWYLEVSQLLLDQQYWGFFIPYAGCRTAAGEYVCRNNVTGAIDAGANLYHDHEQTPGWIVQLRSI